jgi:glutamate-1-semialdehyde 2,1-aminomutase
MKLHSVSESSDQAVSCRYGRSLARHERARRSLAGGVATAFRAAQLPVPVTFERGAGARLWDIDGNEFVDYALAFGPLLFGHSPEPVLAAVERQLRRGLGFGASHELEAELAEAVCRTVPSAELCVFNTTGSEAVHAAVRISRAATGRNRIVKFLGHYDGWYDPIHVGVPPQRIPGPGTAGQDARAAESVTVVRWNDPQALADALADDVAAVIMEPLNVNGGCIPPEPGFLAEAAALTRSAGAVLIFDEVITGYRLSLGGAQERFGVLPDLTVLGKALGGGFPISAVCGSRDLMETVASGPVAHVGTFNANPICAAAALAAIQTLEHGRDSIYPRLERHATTLAETLEAEGSRQGLALRANHDVGVLCAFVSDGDIGSYEATLDADPAAFRRFSAALLDNGVHVIPRGLLYVSTAHADDDVEETQAAIASACASFAREAVPS